MLFFYLVDKKCICFIKKWIIIFKLNYNYKLLEKRFNCLQFNVIPKYPNDSIITQWKKKITIKKKQKNGI